MAKVELILQALTKSQHAEAIREILALPKPTACVLSVGFARTEGVESIGPHLGNVEVKPKVFVGIRNDITSIQALHALLALGVELYIVDTGSRRPIFHPKLYLISAENSAVAIVGSANLTHYGLHNNIEASALIHLDLASEDDAKFVSKVLQWFEDLPKTHPKHVRQIYTPDEANQLFKQGWLCDESVVVAPSAAQQAPISGVVQLTPMKLFSTAAPSKPKKLGPKLVPKQSKNASPLAKTQFIRVWRSKPLVQRDLNVPEGKNTNPTGSIGLKQDAVEEFDFQTYFRTVVFAELAWSPAKNPMKEEATASFQFLIENVEYGTFDLKIAHDNRIDTKSYKQGQFMTQLHWGAAKSIIARKDLIGRTLILYKKETTPPTYLIEID